MRAMELLAKLDGVHQRGARWSARCPAHDDKSPSLSISEGERGILVKCWAGCSVPAICEAIGLQQKDLFFDALDTNPQRRREAAQLRAQRQRELADEARIQGLRIDALREADYHIRSRQGLDIGQWTDQQLDDELNVLADTYALLDSEERDA